MNEAPPDLMAQLVEAWNTHDITRAETFYAPDFVGVDVGQARTQQGPREHCAVLATYIRAFPDLGITAEPIWQDDRVALVWTMTGTHRGRFLRIPPTGRRIAVRGVSVLTLRAGKVWRGETIWDTAGLLRGLGLLPDL